MKDQQPSSDQGDLPRKARDEAAPGAVLADDEVMPGGGGLGGASAADAASGATPGATRNAPIDVPTPDATESDVARDAARRAGDEAEEPRPVSQ